VQWTPQPGDLKNIDPNTNLGHLCLGANCFWPGSSPPSEGADLTDPNSVLDICNEQHHGQTNIAVIPAVSPHIRINLWNFGRQATRFQVGVAEFRPAEAVIRGGGIIRLPGGGTVGPPLHTIIGLGTAQHILAHPAVALAADAVQPETVNLRASAPPDVRNEAGLLTLSEPIEQTLLLSGGHLALANATDRAILHIGPSPVREFSIAGAGGRGHSFAQVIEPNRPGEITFTAAPNPDDRPGAIHVFDLTQRTPTGHLVGGARIVTVNGAHEVR
jgi:hypothetical protein